MQAFIRMCFYIVLFKLTLLLSQGNSFYFNFESLKDSLLNSQNNFIDSVQRRIYFKYKQSSGQND